MTEALKFDVTIRRMVLKSGPQFPQSNRIFDIAFPLVHPGGAKSARTRNDSLKEWNAAYLGIPIENNLSLVLMKIDSLAATGVL
jgi:hypothetical protein